MSDFLRSLIFIFLTLVVLPTYAQNRAHEVSLREVLQFYQNIERSWVADHLKAESYEDFWVRVKGKTVTLGQKLCLSGKCQSLIQESKIVERGGLVYQKMSTGEIYLVTDISFRRIELSDISGTDLEKSIYDLYRKEKIIRLKVTDRGSPRLRRELIDSKDGFTYSKSTYLFPGQSKMRNSCRALF